MAKDDQINSRLVEETGYFWWSTFAIPPCHFSRETAVVGKLSIDEDGHARLELEGVFPSEVGPLAAFDGGAPLPEAKASLAS